MGRTNSSVLAWKVTLRSPPSTQRSCADHTTPSSPHSPPSPSPFVPERPGFIPAVSEEISSEAELIYGRTGHRHRARELFDGSALTQPGCDSSPAPAAGIYPDPGPQH